MEFPFMFPSLAPYWLSQRILSSLISGGNFALLSTTVNQQATSEPDLEERIVGNVASYGKQLGRLVEAGDVLVEQSNGTPNTDKGRRALTEFSNLAGEIATAREQFARDRLDKILNSVAQLGRPGHVDHTALGVIRDLVDHLDRPADHPVPLVAADGTAVGP